LEAFKSVSPLDYLKAVLQGLFKLQEMLNLLSGRHALPRVYNFVGLVHLALSFWWKFQHVINILLIESILGLVKRFQLHFLLRSEFVTIVHNEALLSLGDLFGVVLVDRVDVYVKAHETYETLLTKDSLSLQVALLDHLSGQHISLEQIGPFPNTEFHYSNLEYFNLLRTPTG